MRAFSGIRDVDMKILEQLEDKDLGRACQTNQYVQQLCQNENFWRRRFIDKFGLYYTNNLDLINKYKGDSTWRHYYITIIDLPYRKKIDIDRFDLITLFLFQTEKNYDSILRI